MRLTFKTVMTLGLVVVPALVWAVASKEAQISETAPKDQVVITSGIKDEPAQASLLTDLNDWNKHDHLGSTFTTPAGGMTLTAVTVRNGKDYQASEATSAVVTFYTASDWNDFGTYTPVGSASCAMPATVKDMAYITIPLAKSIELKGETKYAFLFTYETKGRTTGNLVITDANADNNNPYPDGGMLYVRYQRENNEIWHFGGEGDVATGDNGETGPARDLAFWIHGTTAAKAPAKP